LLVQEVLWLKMFQLIVSLLEIQRE